MKNIKHTTVIEGNKVEIEKVYRTRTQFEYFLSIFIGDSDICGFHVYSEVHLTKKSAIKEAKRAIARKPRVERIIY